jgi:hypothetical protein
MLESTSAISVGTGHSHLGRPASVLLRTWWVTPQSMFSYTMQRSSAGRSRNLKGFWIVVADFVVAEGASMIVRELKAVRLRSRISSEAVRLMLRISSDDGMRAEIVIIKCSRSPLMWVGGYVEAKCDYFDGSYRKVVHVH